MGEVDKDLQHFRVVKLKLFIIMKTQTHHQQYNRYSTQSSQYQLLALVRKAHLMPQQKAARDIFIIINTIQRRKQLRAFEEMQNFIDRRKIETGYKRRQSHQQEKKNETRQRAKSMDPEIQSPRVELLKNIIGKLKAKHEISDDIDRDQVAACKRIKHLEQMFHSAYREKSQPEQQPYSGYLEKGDRRDASNEIHRKQQKGSTGTGQSEEDWKKEAYVRVNRHASEELPGQKERSNRQLNSPEDLVQNCEMKARADAYRGKYNKRYVAEYQTKRVEKREGDHNLERVKHFVSPPSFNPYQTYVPNTVHLRTQTRYQNRQPKNHEKRAYSKVVKFQSRKQFLAAQKQQRIRQSDSEHESKRSSSRSSKKKINVVSEVPLTKKGILCDLVRTQVCCSSERKLEERQQIYVRSSNRLANDQPNKYCNRCGRYCSCTPS